MKKFDVRIAFPSGLVRSYLDFLLSFDYPLKEASRTSGILNAFQEQEMLTMKTRYNSHILLLELKCVSCDRSM